jgi:fructose-bisphosphate aldolase class I
MVKICLKSEIGNGHQKMKTQQLKDVARKLVADSKGLLAMDESLPTIKKRFEKAGIPDTEESRRSYRELILTIPGLGEAISGVILFDETIRQKTKDGTPFIEVINESGIIPGIKVDKGTVELAGFQNEKITEGLDGLKERLEEYRQMGALFAKWRAVFSIGENTPSLGCIEANSYVLARYAALCQEMDLVPIVEPEVLMEGSHSLERCEEVTNEVLSQVFQKLRLMRVMPEGMLLKPAMVLPGKDAPQQDPVNRVAEATVNCLMRTVPPAVPGIVFLSGGQPPELASARLNAMNLRFRGIAPWAISFSYARAIHQPAMDVWRGKEENVYTAQKALLHRALCNKSARSGEYRESMEEVGQRGQIKN